MWTDFAIALIIILGMAGWMSVLKDTVKDAVKEALEENEKQKKK
jgi:hypothetical protein